ncbi:class I SAM-dependent methyltransferase [Butyrivibrio sp. X503]|uniref:class I SAM-dependent methyltransferase n=1 Tax=Butyrivibrio sp. X503 TaxID=2364878 RepID=UPI000EA8E130|nr:class I SAM-dependent methyltransferase [Butyrivibrio sp. X503]RKM56558.1 class I SAM-dependent methyltransferase [Butyrivibrio sp. X503]
MNSKSFDSKRIAMGYTKRPWLHKSVIEQLKRDCDIAPDHIFKNGLDVGCGAGLSTKALKLICDKVTGTDIADAMVEACKKLYGDNNAYAFYTAKAEETRLPEEKYDIVTAAGCINWVDEKIFMANMSDVMEDGGLLVIYDFGITNRMAKHIMPESGLNVSPKPESGAEVSQTAESDAYTHWYNDEYLTRFPKPPRKENKWTQEDLPKGFTMEKQTEYDMVYSFTIEEFVDFMLIQSNVNTQIESGTISAEEAKEWMTKSLLPIFDNKDRGLIFSGYSWYIRKN